MSKEYQTRCRASIMEYCEKHNESSFSASDIHEYLTKKGDVVNLATIYRNLEKMTENGNLIKYKSASDDRCLYQYVKPESDCGHHLHMQCRKCSKIIHMECDFMKDLSDSVSKKYGFNIECNDSLISGICDECKNNF